jgi:ribosomal protein S18 acetylase RimI-like enzyme
MSADQHLVLRRATLEDAAAIARLHVAVWRETYRELAPPSVVRALDEAERRERWTRSLGAEEPTAATFVIETEEKLAAFGHCGSPSHPSFGARGEVKFLYVGRAHARKGFGRKLLATMAEALSGRGYSGFGLGVVVGNAPAIAFYEALGGTVLARYTDPGPLWPSENLLYVWDGPAAAAVRRAPAAGPPP